MTMQTSSDIACPSCKHEQTFVVWQSVNATLNPDLRDKLMSGQFSVFTCEACGYQADLTYPFLYHDMAKKFMIWFLPGEGKPQPLDLTLHGAVQKDYAYRLVRSLNALIEKIRIFEDGLDDRVLELLKSFLRQGEGAIAADAGGLLLYDGQTTDPAGLRQIQFVLIGAAEPSTVALKAEAYDELKFRFASAFPDGGPSPVQWLEVDPGYAQNVIAEINRTEDKDGEKR